jgi:hypothetical protein
LSSLVEIVFEAIIVFSSQGFDGNGNLFAEIVS